MSGSDGLGRQGGDLPFGSAPAVDLSTCRNQYGVAPAVRAIVSNLTIDDYMEHPYGASEAVLTAYASFLGCERHELAPSRGISGAIWNLARSVDTDRVALPRPCYTEYVRAFPGRMIGRPDVKVSLEVVIEALERAQIVILSNPLNPSGSILDAHTLAQAAAANPHSILVIDESYVEFVGPEGHNNSLVGSEAPNIAVLRSPSKFFGVAGARVGVVWSRDADLRALLGDVSSSWPLGRPEAMVAIASVKDDGWANATRNRIRDDADWLAKALRGSVVGTPRANFALVDQPDAQRICAQMADAGVRVRILGPPHGVPYPMIRIAAPRSDDRATVRRALAHAGIFDGNAGD